MTTMFQDLVKWAVCGKESDHSFNGSTKALGELDLDTNPDKIELSALPYIVQRCPKCGYCNSRLSELIKGADEYLYSDEYRAQLINEKFPELANSFLCAGLLHEYMEEYGKAGWFETAEGYDKTTDPFLLRIFDYEEKYPKRF